ncbi:hypothetical protein KKB71_01825 [Patescibacteria group bacterium]|nr:hypothetical protein [Patescibacteria group bacterium]MBU2219105.1 hypothetical protein [Patescibacteria group bacterium]MBU2263550.1 hypothetical protein [Patescibacteria group bacterium]
MDKETKQEFENLARMVKIGFDETAKKESVDKRFDDVGNRFDDVDSQLYEIRKDMSEIKTNVVYRDEFEKLTLEFEDLTGRVKYLEKKMGIESGK